MKLTAIIDIDDDELAARLEAMGFIRALQALPIPAAPPVPEIWML